MSFDNLMGYIIRYINVYAKLQHNIPLSSRDSPIITFFQNLELQKASTIEKCHFDISWARSCQCQCLRKKNIKLFHSVQEIGPFLRFQNLALGKDSTDNKCHFAIPWARSCQYQCVCKILSKYSKRFELNFTFIRTWTSAKPGLFSLFQNWTSATPRPIPNDIGQSFWLHLVIINAYAKFHQNIPNGLRVINIFYEQAGDKIFTNRQVTKSNAWL